MSILSENIDYSAIVGETYLVSVQVDRMDIREFFKEELIEDLRDVAGHRGRADISDRLSTLLYDKLIKAPNAYLDSFGLNALFEEYGSFMFVETTDESPDWRSRDYGLRYFNSGKSVHITLTPRANVSFERRS